MTAVHKLFQDFPELPPSLILLRRMTTYTYPGGPAALHSMVAAGLHALDPATKVDAKTVETVLQQKPNLFLVLQIGRFERTDAMLVSPPDQEAGTCIGRLVLNLGPNELYHLHLPGKTAPTALRTLGPGHAFSLDAFNCECYSISVPTNPTRQLMLYRHHVTRTRPLDYSRVTAILDLMVKN